MQLLQVHTHTIKFCCSGDHEYMTGTEATALRVFRGMTCLGKSEKPLSTVHCSGQNVQSELYTFTETFSTRQCTDNNVNLPTSRVPLKEPTDVMMWTGWIRLVFHSWFKMSVRSMIFWRLVLNMLCKKHHKEQKTRNLSAKTYLHLTGADCSHHRPQWKTTAEEMLHQESEW